MDRDREALDLLARLREDQRRRWLAGDRAAAEFYFEKHPDLLADEELAVDLIYSEVLLRGELGETVVAEDYIARFPRFAEALQRQFSFGNLFSGEGSSPGPSGDKAPPDDLRKLLAEMIPGYEILGEVGRGRRGWVCRAMQLDLKRIVALKIVRSASDEARQSLHREVAAVARLNHPNILPIFETGEIDDRCHWSMELALNTLEKALHHGPWPVPEAASLVETLARALAAAQAEGIVHGNLKPTNIMLTADGTPKLADFGLNHKPHGPGISAKSKSFPGTVAYLAPEQTVSGDGPPSTAIDIHALGAILHQLVTGQRLFRGSGLHDTLELIRTHRPAPLKADVCPVDLDTIRLKCLEKNPARRYGSMVELANDLARHRSGKTIEAKRPRPLALWWQSLFSCVFIPGTCPP